MFINTSRLVSSLFVLLLIGAACFSLERILFADASFILFRIVNQESLQVQEHRYGSFITQCFPLLATRLQLPLRVIVLLYSVSFQVFYLAVVLLLLYRFRQTSLAVLMSFYYLLFVSDTWFWVNNEVHQGIAWMFLFFAVVRSMAIAKKHWMAIFFVFLVLSFLTLFTHPLLLFPTAFLWLFFMLENDWPFSRKWTVLYSIVLLALAAWKLLLSAGATSHYDAEKLQHTLHPSMDAIVQGFRSPFFNEMMQRMLWNYWLVPVLFIVGIAGALRQKKYRLLLLTVSFSTVYFLAVLMTFKDFVPFYTESELMPLTIMLTAPFVYFVLPSIGQRRSVVLLAFIFLVRLGYIGVAAPQWVERKDWVFQTLKTMRRKHVSKALIYETEQTNRKLFITWGLPVESILASALQNEVPQRTFVVDKPENLQQRLPGSNLQFISSFETLDVRLLNQRYFQIDTGSGYKLLH